MGGWKVTNMDFDHIVQNAIFSVMKIHGPLSVSLMLGQIAVITPHIYNYKYYIFLFYTLLNNDVAT